MILTLQLSDELAAFLPHGDAEMAAVISAGLGKLGRSRQHQVERLADVAEFLANLPPLEEVLAMRPTKGLSDRTDALLTKNREASLSGEEQAEWDEIVKMEHVMRVAKARAVILLKSADRTS